jgi:hypothetical protein
MLKYQPLIDYYAKATLNGTIGRNSNMLEPKAARKAATVANRCLGMILTVKIGDVTLGRNPEQVALIGKIIETAIRSTQHPTLIEMLESTIVEANGKVGGNNDPVKNRMS